MIPKLRVWDKASKRMRRVYSINFTAKYVICFQDYDDEDDKKLKYIYFKDCEIMQFIGVTDKNKTEIYEGDIVLPTAMYKVGFAVKWNSKTSEFLLRRQGSWTKPCPLTSKVIGNIYENPELLK